MPPYSTSYAAKRKRVSAIVKKYAKAKSATGKSTIIYSPYVEKKISIVTAASTFATLAGGSVISLCDIAGGTGRDQRQGNRVTFTGMEIFWTHNCDLVSVNGGARILIVQDLRTTGTLPAAAAGATGILNAADFRAGLNLDTSERFIILYDKFLGNNGLYFDRKVVDMKVTTLYKSATAGEYIKNGIYALIFPTFSSASYSVNYNIRMHFADV